MDTQQDLLMRKETDYRPSEQVKEDNLPDILHKINFAIEDNPKCQRMYMENDFLLIG